MASPFLWQNKIPFPSTSWFLFIIEWYLHYREIALVLGSYRVSLVASCYVSEEIQSLKEKPDFDLFLDLASEVGLRVLLLRGISCWPAFKIIISLRDLLLISRAIWIHEWWLGLHFGLKKRLHFSINRYFIGLFWTEVKPYWWCNVLTP